MGLKWIGLAAILLIAHPAIAGLKDIHREKLPQDKQVQKVYADVLEVEEFVQQWSETWRYETPKSTVVAVVKTSLAALQKALPTAPNNVELLLLTGLVAHYAHNVEVDGAYEVAVDSLEKAKSLVPEDYRSDWFLGIHQCQSNQAKKGMDRLLSIERSLPWGTLPASYWDDYLYCANLANMPAHAIRAGSRAATLDARPSRDRDFLIETAQKRFSTPDVTANYSAEKAWYAKNTGPDVVFTGPVCGLSFVSHGEWNLNLGVYKGVCLVQIQAGPHAGKKGRVFPNILVLARQPKAGETLRDFLNTILPDMPTKNISLAACPSQECLSVTGVKAGGYEPEGDGHVLMTAFKRDAPEFPGLLFEEPMAPTSTEAGKVEYFRPEERMRRLEGVLYYVIMLDTASSVLEKAKSDYENFLKGIRVE